MFSIVDFGINLVTKNNLFYGFLCIWLNAYSSITYCSDTPLVPKKNIFIVNNSAIIANEDVRNKTPLACFDFIGIKNNLSNNYVSHGHIYVKTTTKYILQKELVALDVSNYVPLS